MGMNLDSGELLAVKQVFFLVYFCVLGSLFWFGIVILLLVCGFWRVVKENIMRKYKRTKKK
jgi:hypothetical protein